MIAAERDGENVRHSDAAAAVLGGRWRRYDTLLDRADGQNRRLRRIDDGRELRDAEHAEIADGERAALELVRLQLAVARTRRQRARRVRNLADAKLIGVLHDRRQQAAIGRDGNADVDIVMSNHRILRPTTKQQQQYVMFWRFEKSKSNNQL